MRRAKAIRLSYAHPNPVGSVGRQVEEEIADDTHYTAHAAVDACKMVRVQKVSVQLTERVVGRKRHRERERERPKQESGPIRRYFAEKRSLEPCFEMPNCLISHTALGPEQTSQVIAPGSIPLVNRFCDQLSETCQMEPGAII
jgi:hypothetical protein